MQLHLIFIGKTSLPEALEGIPRYLGRIEHYCRVRVHTVRAEKIAHGTSEPLVQQKETKRILELVGTDHPLVAWDQRGTQLSSPGLAKLVSGLENSGVPRVWMAIGGPLGFDADLRRRADHLLALSHLTFPHDLARLLVLEQIYRAFTIIRNEPYHK